MKSLFKDCEYIFTTFEYPFAGCEYIFKGCERSSPLKENSPYGL